MDSLPQAHRIVNDNQFGDGISISLGDTHYHGSPHRSETPPSPSIVIPFSRDEHFVDRKDTANTDTILDVVDQKCQRPGSRTALVGLGGVGKSQVAIEYAYQVRDRSPDTWVFWVHASNAARFEEGFRGIANCAKIFGRQDPKAKILQLVHDWLHDRAKGPWVVVLDNVDDASFLTSPIFRNKTEASKTAQVETGRSLLSYIPHCQQGSVLVTSRNRDEALKIVEDVDIVTVEPMNAEDSETLFRWNLNRPEATDATELIAELVTLLECMPLAIVQAAAYISQRWPRCSVKQYLNSFQASDRKKTGLLGYEGGKLRRDPSAKNSILITWQMSFDHIRKEMPSAADILSVMSFCDPQGIPEMLLRGDNGTDQLVSHQARTSTTDGDDDNDDDDNDDDENRWDNDSVLSLQSEKSDIDTFEEDILVLRNFSFLRANEDGQSFEMHRLVQMSTLDWLQLQGKKEDWRYRFLAKLSREMPTGAYENWGRCRALYPHVRWAATKMPKRRGSIAEWATVLYRTAWYCEEMGDSIEAERLSVSAWKARQKILEVDHNQILGAMHMVALAYDSQGRWKEAEKLFVQVLEGYKNKLGEDHPSTLTSMGNLASTYRNQGRWEEAKKLEVQVLEGRKKKLRDDHPDTLLSMNNLASTYGNQGRWKEAEKLQLQVLEGYKNKLGEDHPSTLTSMGNLASTYRNQGRWIEAEKLEVQVLEGRKKKLGEDHPDTLGSMGNLASTYRNQGRWEEAEKLQLQVLEGYKNKLGEDHPSMLRSMGNLASTYKNQGRWIEAEKLEVQVLEGRKKKLGEDHPDTLGSMGNLAYTWHNIGEQAKAINLMNVCIRLRQARLGPDHPNTQSLISALNTWGEKNFGDKHA